MKCQKLKDLIQIVFGFSIYPQALQIMKSNFLIILAVLRRMMYCEFAGPFLRHCACGQHSSFQRNVAAVASRSSTMSNLAGSIFVPQPAHFHECINCTVFLFFF